MNGPRLIILYESVQNIRVCVCVCVCQLYTTAYRVVAWTNPELKVSAGWPIPDFWVPILANVGAKLPPNFTINEVSVCFACLTQIASSRSFRDTAPCAVSRKHVKTIFIQQADDLENFNPVVLEP
jgi:hypothetical protein